MGGFPIQNRGRTFDGFAFMQKNVEYDQDGRELYIGYATPGELGAAESWLITKLTHDISSRVTAIRFADNSISFDKAWDSRASYTYA